MASTPKPEETNEFLELMVIYGSISLQWLFLIIIWFVRRLLIGFVLYTVNALLQIETKKNSGALMGDLGSLFSSGSL